MIKKLLVVMAAGVVVSLVCFSVLGMIGGFQALNNGPWNFGPFTDWRNGPDPGPETTRDLAYAGSTRLNIYYPAEITYTQGDQPKFTVTGPQFLLDQLRLDDGELRLDNGGNYRGRPRFRWNGRNNGDGRLRIEITAPNLHEFHLAGAQQLRIKAFNQDTLEVQASGAADVEGQGRARRLEARISGAGDLKFDDLTVDDADITITGAGDVHADARQSSQVHMSGAGDVHLKCRPPHYEDHKSGFGDVSYGPDCSTLPAEPAPPASSAAPAAPAAPAQPAAPASKSKV
jgi:hypothetical protein